MALLDFLFDKQRRSSRGQEDAPPPSPPIASGDKAREAHAPTTGVDTEPNIDRIREELETIADLIGPGESYDLLSESDGNITALTLKATDVVSLASDAFSPHGRETIDPTLEITILVSDLFEQLSSGEVATTLGQLTADLDPKLLVENIADLRDRRIPLPLPLVVSAVRPDDLTARTTKREREPELDAMPDVFARLDEADALPAALEDDVELFDPTAPATPQEPVEAAAEPEAVQKLETANGDGGLFLGMEEDESDEIEEPVILDKAEEDEAEAVREEAVEPVIDMAAPDGTDKETVDVKEGSSLFGVNEEILDDLFEADAEDLPVEAAPEPGPVVAEERKAPAAVENTGAVTPAERQHQPLLVRGIDVNAVSAGDLVTRLDGIGPKMGVRIVEDRELNGPFADVYDLARIEGIGPKTFETLTGLPWRDELCANIGLLGEILESSRRDIPDVRAVAERMHTVKGFEGCVITYRDGYVLATSWDHQMNDTLGAFSPQMFKKVTTYIKRLKLGEMDAFTFFFEEYPITLVNNGDIFLAAVHSPGRFSRRHVQIARTLTAELARRLKRFGRR